MAKDIYGRSRTIGGRAIRAFDNVGLNKWSHCGCVTTYYGSLCVIEARAFHGVVRTPFEDFLRRYAETEVVEFTAPREIEGDTWLHLQVGAPYDYLAIFGSMFRTHWAEEGAYQCAELLESRRIHAGCPPRFRLGPDRITPNMSYSNLAGVITT